MDYFVPRRNEFRGAAVQAAAYPLIPNLRVGQYVLSDNVPIVAAGNREADKGVTYRMSCSLC